MSRQIKFRAWDLDHKEFVYISQTEDGEMWVNNGISTTVMPYHKCELEQYTGLEDKNGKEIYEGDIVEEDIDFNSEMTDGTFRYKVYWNEDELCWSLDPISQESIHNDLWELNSSCRVIGNIHEPPKDFRPEHLKRMGVSISKGGKE